MSNLLTGYSGRTLALSLGLLLFTLTSPARLLAQAPPSAELDNNVTELRASDGVNLGTFPTGSYPDGVAFDGANIWVVNAGSGTVPTIS
jgi:hypothetical protein